MQKYDLTVREYVQQKKAAGLKALSFDSIARVLVGSLQGLTFLAKRNVIHRGPLLHALIRGIIWIIFVDVYGCFLCSFLPRVCRHQG